MATENNPLLRRLRTTGWLLVFGVAGLLGLSLLVVLLVTGVLSGLLVGVPLLLLALLGLRKLADGYRLWAWHVLGLHIARPYRPLPDGTVLVRTRALLHDPATWREVGWLALNSTGAALLCLIPPLSLVSCAFWAANSPLITWLVPGWIRETYSRILTIGDTDLQWIGMVLIVPLEIALFWLATERIMRAYGLFLEFFLGPPRAEQLAQRVDELAESRAEAVDTSAAELRRVERDLHDGAQARLVSLGMTLGMAEQLMATDPKMAQELLAEARESSGQALSELRDLVRGIHPPVLADRGLDGAVRALAMSNPMPVDVEIELPERLPQPVESAVYFAVAETLTNAAKHSGADHAWVRIGARNDSRLEVVVRDDGCGGASNEAGGGLRGIQRRLAAFDGTMTIVSPPGGPTTITMELPCALSSAKTMHSSETG